MKGYRKEKAAQLQVVGKEQVVLAVMEVVPRVVVVDPAAVAVVAKEEEEEEGVVGRSESLGEGWLLHHLAPHQPCPEKKKNCQCQQLLLHQKSLLYV